MYGQIMNLGAGCFVLFVFLASRDCCVALPRGAMVCPQFVIVVFLIILTYYFLDKTVA